MPETEGIAKEKMPMKGVIYALLASLLFGVTTPLAKALLVDVKPVLLAGLFYLGSGIGLLIYRGILRCTRETSAQPVLRRKDWFWLAGAIAFGGIIAPVFLMFGLSNTQASSASLFLNIEGVFTALIAWFVFKENFDRRIFIGMLLIVAGGIVLSFDGGGIALSLGVVLITLACIGWAVDNNLTRKVSHFDATQIACVKGLTSGVVNVCIAIAIGAFQVSVPTLATIAAALVIGFLGYGVSLVLYVLALRNIGAARTGAYFAIAPFVGAVVSIFLFKEQTTPQLMVAAVLMAAGLYLHLTEVHNHEHEHEEMEHEHEHVHDEHHQHEHGSSDPPGEPHVHWHRHQQLKHGHPHFPDQHHQHEH